MYDQELHEAAVDLRNLLGRPGGWIQNAASDGKGGYCLIGGVYRVVGTEDHVLSRNRVFNALRDALNDEDVERVGLKPIDVGIDLVRYNNHPYTTQDDIVALVDRVVNATAPEPAVPQLKVQEELVNV